MSARSPSSRLAQTQPKESSGCETKAFSRILSDRDCREGSRKCLKAYAFTSVLFENYVHASQ